MIPTAQRMHRHVQNSSSFMKFRSAVDDSDDDSDDDTIIVDNKVINDAVSNLNCVDNSVADESKETHNNKNCKNHTQQFKEEDEIVPWSSRKGKSKGWQLLYDLLMDVRSSRQLPPWLLKRYTDQILILCATQSTTSKSIIMT